MPRPRNKRKIDSHPVMEGFKPFGIPLMDLDPVILLFEEYESIKLADYEGLTQEEASVRMKVSRPTFTRIYMKARQSIAKAFIEGKAILIEGGDYKMNHSKGFCICVKCNMRIPHERGIPCRDNKCPTCGKTMLRENSFHHQLFLNKQREKNENSSTDKK